MFISDYRVGSEGECEGEQHIYLQTHLQTLMSSVREKVERAEVPPSP